MKNICFLVGSLNNSGGTERVATLIANGLAKSSNHNVLILSLSDSDNPFFDLNPVIDVHSIHSGNVSFKKKFIQTVLKIRKFVIIHNIHTLIVVDSLSCIFSIPALYNLSIKHICWENFSFNDNNGTILRDLARKLSAKYCDYVITLTQRDKEIWCSNLKRINANIVSISNPSPFFDIQHKPNLNFKTILAVGRLTKVKGFDLLIKSWALVCQVNDDWILRIVGSGEDENELKQLVKTLDIIDRVSFIPATKDIEMHYRTSSFYCLSSRYEGFGMVIVEAQSFGLPVISFDCHVGPREIINHKIDGWLLPSENVENLKDMILEVVDLSEIEYEYFVENSFKNSKLFSVDSILEKWEKLV